MSSSKSTLRLSATLSVMDWLYWGGTGLVILALAYILIGQAFSPLSVISPQPHPSRSPALLAPRPKTTVLVGVGDIGTCNGDGDEKTWEVFKTISANSVTLAPLGDLAYERGSNQEFADCYTETWGQASNRTRPVPGNHEYRTPHARGYYAYFGERAGEPHQGYYSYNLGGWHIVALNSNCDDIGGCDANSPQVQWLRTDLEAHPTACTLAYWHEPRFSSGYHGNDTQFQTFWEVLYEYNADIVWNGHDHDYERFAPQDPSGALDLARGIREFVVGTGGRSHRAFRTPQPNSEVRNADTFGLLVLTLQPTSYTWEFRPEAGKTFTDSGNGVCH